MKITVNEIIEITGGTLLCGSAEALITNIQYDSRAVGEGSLFVPIKGEKVDPHDFIADCFAKGAAAALTERTDCGCTDGTLIQVKSTLAALQQIAAFYRSRSGAKVIGVTGSVGKTSTKEMLAAALSGGFDVMKTQGNRNSQIGLPITMLDIEPHHEVAVIEMGMSEFGEMDKLCDIARPDMAVMTNIGKAHIENLGTQQNIMSEKLRITKHFGSSGILFLNGDDPLLRTLHGSLPFHTVTYGLSKECDFFADSIVPDGFHTTFTCHYQGKTAQITIPALGQHSVANAAAAFAVGTALGLAPSAIQSGLLTYKNAPMRQQICELDGFILIDDSYNASPEATKISLDVLKSVAGGKTIAVLADMLELGEEAPDEHYAVGRHLAEQGIDVLLAVGTLSENTAKGASDNGCALVKHFNDNAGAYEYLRQLIEPGCTVLVKGSRGMHTDEICKKLRDAYSVS